MLKKILSVILITCCLAANAQRDKEEFEVAGDPLFKSAYNKFEQKLYKESYEDYTNYLRKNPAHTVALYNRGLCSFYLEDYKTGIRDFKESIDLGYKTASNYYMMGECKFYLGNYQEAIAEYDACLVIKPSDYRALSSKGGAYMMLGKYTESLKYLNEALAIRKNYEYTYSCLTQTKFYLKDHQGGLEDAEKALALSNKVNTHFWKGVHLIELKKHKEAIPEFDLVISAKPKYALAYYNRGVAHYNLAEYDKSIQDYTNSIELDPQHANSHYGRALALYYAKNYVKAEIDFNSAIAMGVTTSTIYCDRAANYIGLKKTDLALNDINKALELNKDYSWSYFYRARIKYEDGDYEGSVADNDKALSYLKNYATYYNRGLSKHYLKDYAGAAEDFGESLKFKPNDPYALAERGANYYLIEKDEMAMADLNNAIKLDPSIGKAYYFRGKLKKVKNDMAGFCEDLKTALHLGYTKAEDFLNKNGCK